jgi:hypothetical protein
MDYFLNKVQLHLKINKIEQNNLTICNKKNNQKNLRGIEIPQGKLIHSTIEDDGVKFTLLLGIRDDKVYVLDSIKEDNSFLN